MSEDTTLRLPMADGGTIVISKSCTATGSLFIEHWNAAGTLEDTWTRTIDEVEALFGEAFKEKSK